MNENLDDFEDDFAEGEVQRPASPAAKPGMAGNLKAAWNGSPLFKLFVLVVGVGALAAAIIGILSGGDAAKKNATSVNTAPGISAVPGTKAPPAYVEAVNQASQQRAEEAIQSGKSALPTPVSSDAGNSGLNNDDDQSKYDPLAEFRPNVPQDSNVAQQAPTLPTDSVDSDLLQKMQSQMTALFETWRPEGIKGLQVVDPASLKKEVAETNTGAPVQGRVLVPSGTIAYAQLLMEANTDAPGPVLAEIMSGPFTGGRAIGAFEATREYLILKFTKISYKKREYEINAIALDPNTTLPGLVTEKDNRYFTRVLLPAAAGFLEGFSSALSQSSTTTTINGNSIIVANEAKNGLKDGIYQGISEGTRTIGSFFRDEAAATKPLIRVAVGTPMGLFFVNSVTDGANSNTINTPIQPVNNNGGGSILPAPNPPVAPVSIGTPESAQSSLAKSGVNIIQSTPDRAP